MVIFEYSQLLCMPAGMAWAYAEKSKNKVIFIWSLLLLLFYLNHKLYRYFPHLLARDKHKKDTAIRTEISYVHMKLWKKEWKNYENSITSMSFKWISIIISECHAAALYCSVFFSDVLTSDYYTVDCRTITSKTPVHHLLSFANSICTSFQWCDV